MSYVVLARKLRPQQFSDLVGQENIARILKTAVKTGRVAHAFLFTGSRGVGKTSSARILTKALNCLNPQDGDPCCECTNCIEITRNASPDVFEIDAASNRGIENIRELRDNVKYAPAHSRFKVYIIDEAHMLTLESFNALLKTLEEPPPHVKFILATTDPHKLPATIISRCQRYDFVRIPLKPMVSYLEDVIKQEGIQLSRKALELVARNSIGGMRDALSAVDQILSFAGAAASDEEVAGLLGMIDSQSRLALLSALLEKDLLKAMQALQTMQEHGHHFQDIMGDLLSSVKTVTMLTSFRQQGIAAPPSFFQDLTSDEMERFGELAGRASLDQLQQVFLILLELEERLKRSNHAKTCFEMAIVEITAVQPLVGITDLLHQVEALRQGKPVQWNLQAMAEQGRQVKEFPPAARPTPTAEPPVTTIPAEQVKKKVPPPALTKEPKVETVIAPEPTAPSSSPEPVAPSAEPMMGQESLVAASVPQASVLDEAELPSAPASPPPDEAKPPSAPASSILEKEERRSAPPSQHFDLEKPSNVGGDEEVAESTHEQELEASYPDSEPPLHVYENYPAYSEEESDDEELNAPDWTRPTPNYQPPPPPVQTVAPASASQPSQSAAAQAPVNIQEVELPALAYELWSDEEVLYFQLVEFIRQVAPAKAAFMGIGMISQRTENSLTLAFKSKQTVDSFSGDEQRLLETQVERFFGKPLKLSLRLEADQQRRTLDQCKQVLAAAQEKERVRLIHQDEAVKLILETFPDSQVIIE